MKLALIALSGVRAYDRELTAIGLTLPGFVERSKTIASLPSLGLLTLAGMTPGDIEVDYIEFDGETPADGMAGQYDAVAISSFSARIKDAYALARQCRAAGIRVILGGLHVTARPEEAGACADTIVIGEAEPVWPQVIDDLRHDALKPVYDARATPFDLADAPMPRFDLLDPSRYNRLTVQTQRGCPFDCEFCAASIRLSPGYRVKPVEKVIAEIRAIKAIWPRPFIEFADDNTFANKSHSKQLLRALAHEGVRWFTETDISIARDERLLELMADSGCAQVLIGLENPSRSALHGVETRGNWKAKQTAFYREAIERIQRRGIRVNGCFVLGLDGADKTSFSQIARFVRDSGLYDVQVTILTPFPGTPLYDRLKREGRLLHDGAWERCTLFDLNFQPRGMSVDEFVTQFHELVRELYSESSTAMRRAAFAAMRSAGKKSQPLPEATS